MLKGIDTINWAKLTNAYGTAKDVRRGSKGPRWPQQKSTTIILCSSFYSSYKQGA